jgi:uncharacterized protein (UPF0212 family)
VRALDSTTLLTAWEHGASQPMMARALGLLAAARPDRSIAEWGSVTIGERDRELLRLRETLFGNELEATAMCPECGERLELAFSTRDVIVPALPAPGDSPTVRIETSGYEIVCRAPACADLADVPDRATLLERCVEIAKRGAEDVRVSALPEAATMAIAEAIQKIDPQADVNIALTCPACGHAWQSIFDIASFLWGEIEDWARRLLLDVHLLASAYGWSERDILAMSPQRRGLYLEMAGAA